jgi:predicted GNAT family acetyltransferase
MGEVELKGYESLAVLLLPRGECPLIGREEYEGPCWQTEEDPWYPVLLLLSQGPCLVSHRFVIVGNHVKNYDAALQVVFFGGKLILSNVFTPSWFRRKGYARLLLKRAREYFGGAAIEIREASPLGRAWAEANGVPVRG